MQFSTKRLLLLLTFSLIMGSNFSFASHIVGGDITVKRLSANTYEVTSTFYRDCSSTTGYENPIYIGVYDKVTHAQQQVITSYISSQNILTLGDACFTPSLCIEKAVYITTVTIPDNANGYYLSWLRCCRNASITNIISPGDDGYVMYAEIANPAIVNSSPVFNSIPDGYMCRNYLNSDDFSASDADGDVLVYSFSTPLSCNPTGQCSPTFPNPSGSTTNLPGPYGTINWQTGYSLANPMGDPAMAVNSSTGMISATPPNLGVYVVSVKVSEYRAGVKIGEIRRDFQYEILNCTVLNLTVNPGNPVCSGTQTTITAIGATPGSTYLWNLGSQTTSAIVVTPTSSGSYNYTVTATNGSCISTSSTTLVTNPNPTPTVTVAGNPCIGQYSTLTAGGGVSYSWSNGSTNTTLSGIAAGNYTVAVTSALGCTASTTVNVVAPVVSNTYTWTGGGTTGANNWFDANNWGGCIPSCPYDAIIPNTPALAVSNPPDIGTASGIASCRSITIGSSNTLSFSNANAELDVCGDFTQHGTVSPATMGKIKFIGNVTQNYTRSSTASNIDHYQVILANTASPPLLIVKEGVGYLDLAISSTGSFIFQTGIVKTEGMKKLHIKNTAGSCLSGHGASAYVYGRLKRNVIASTSYDFPVGAEPIVGNAFPYQLMNINFSALGSVSDMVVSFENPTNANGTGLPVTDPSASSASWATLLDNGGANTGVGYSGTIGGVWTIIPNSYASAPTYDMTLYGRNYDNAGAYEHTILKRNTFCPGVWTASGTYNASSVAGNIVMANRTGLSGFSQVAIAETPIALPIELYVFDASCDDQKTKLSWVTASETNNDFFTLERSCDENYHLYEVITTIPGAGTSNTMKEYSYVDKDETGGECYYRLSQTDFNGTTVVYDPISINCKDDANFNFIGILPNPADDEVNILFSSLTESAVTMQLSDMMGQDLETKEISAELGLNKFKINIGNLPAGIYFITLYNGDRSFIKKVVKRK